MVVMVDGMDSISNSVFSAITRTLLNLYCLFQIQTFSWIDLLSFPLKTSLNRLVSRLRLSFFLRFEVNSYPID